MVPQDEVRQLEECQILGCQNSQRGTHESRQEEIEDWFGRLGDYDSGHRGHSNPQLELLPIYDLGSWIIAPFHSTQEIECTGSAPPHNEIARFI